MLKHILISLALLVAQFCFAGKVDTVAIYSAAMKKNINCVVITPDNYKKVSAFPTVYLLHGHGGKFSNWITRVPTLSKYADTYQTIIVCPDGATNGWYINATTDANMQYETYIGKEVPAYIDANFKTIKDRKARAITGLSMGGHGGLFLGFKNAGFFGACGSMSGALVIELITDKRYGISNLLGDTSHKDLYRANSIMGQMENYPKDSLAIIIDCGTEDFIVEMSRAAHKKMLDLKIPHDYIERPGKHDWAYWATAVEVQLLFFRNYFNKGR